MALFYYFTHPNFPAWPQ